MFGMTDFERQNQVGRRERFGGMVLLVVCGVVVSGCQSTPHMVVAATGTNIGLEMSQNAANQSPQAKLGYNRAEIAIVPTNRGNIGDSHSDGADETAEVLMELKYSNIFSGSNSGIYQRLAVGKTAVSQKGAAFMFAKDAQGDLNPTTAQYVAKAEEQIALEEQLTNRIIEHVSVGGSAVDGATLNTLVATAASDYPAKFGPGVGAAISTIATTDELRRALAEDFYDQIDPLYKSIP